MPSREHYTEQAERRTQYAYCSTSEPHPHQLLDQVIVCMANADVGTFFFLFFNRQQCNGELRDGICKL